jgi:hypothetical protein
MKSNPSTKGNNPAKDAATTETKKVGKVKTNPSTPKADAPADVKAKSADEVKKKITAEKDLLYLYPESVNTLEKRKTYRRGIRTKIHSLAKQLVKAEGKEKKELIKEVNEFAKEHYTKEGIAKNVTPLLASTADSKK